jgi:hypothetical protein
LNERGRGLSFASELWRYVTTGTAMLTYGASQCVFAPASYKPGLIRKLDDTPGITGGGIVNLADRRRLFPAPLGLSGAA